MSDTRSNWEREINRTLDLCVDNGHDPVKVSKDGAIALYACRKCRRTTEVWDGPVPFNGGPMPRSRCGE